MIDETRSLPEVDGGHAANGSSLGTVGPYRLLERIGEGGMGTVFRAEQTEPVRRTVALKLIRAGHDTARFVARFESERQALAMMSHSGIARVFDAGSTSDGHPYLAMEFVEGVPITAYCRDARTPLEDRLTLFGSVCDAVHHAHQKGIIHRDIKPSNILVTLQDGAPMPKVIDFGVAKAISEPLTATMFRTQVGAIVGTPLYMAPEQFEPEKFDVDIRADVYALGVLLYELMTGSTTLPSSELSQLTLEDMIRRIRTDDPVRPSERVSKDGAQTGRLTGLDPQALGRRLRGDIDWIAIKALERDRTRRYGSAAELAEDIRRHVRFEPVVARPPSRTYRAARFVRRHRVGVAATAVVAVALIVGSIAATVGFVRARRAEQTARAEAETSRRVAEFLQRIFEVSDPGVARGNSITARELLDRGIAEIEKGLQDDPSIKARLLETMGTVYRNLGLYDEARPLLERSVALDTGIAGRGDPRTIEAENALVGLLIKAGKLPDAEIRLADLVSRSELATGKDSLETARAVNNRAAYAMKAGHWAAAAPDLERALAIRERLLGPEHPDVAKVLTNLGTCRTYLGEYDRAAPALARALEIRTKVLGADHLDTATTLSNRGVLRQKTGDIEGARRDYAAALEVFVKVLGPQHPTTRTTAEALAKLGQPTVSAQNR